MSFWGPPEMTGWRQVKRKNFGGEETRRPPGVLPEFWNKFTDKEQEECIAEWEQHKKNMKYDPVTGEYTIPPAVQCPGAAVTNPRSQAPTTIVCLGNEHQHYLAVEQERLGGMFEGYSLESLGKRAPVRHAKDCIESMDNVLLIGSFPESALIRDDFGRMWQNWVSAASTARRCGASYALIMPKMSKFLEFGIICEVQQ